MFFLFLLSDIIYYLLFQLAIVGDTERGWCVVHTDRNVAVNIITHIRFYTGLEKLSNLEGCTIFYPGGQFSEFAYCVEMKHLRCILANFRQVFHNAHPWQHGRACFSVYTDHRVLDFCHAFDITSYNGNICHATKKNDKEILALVKVWRQIREEYKLI